MQAITSVSDAGDEDASRRGAAAVGGRARAGEAVNARAVQRAGSPAAAEGAPAAVLRAGLPLRVYTDIRCHHVVIACDGKKPCALTVD